MANQWLVTRHPGALAWLKGKGIQAEAVAHLDVSRVQPGDTVYGTLPLNLAARVCERGARFFYLAMELPASLRGQELSAVTMDALGARLEQYTVARSAEVGDPPKPFDTGFCRGA